MPAFLLSKFPFGQRFGHLVWMEERFMEQVAHDLQGLFAQLGEPSDDEAIERFIEMHGALANGVRLHEAHFWTVSQAQFLHDSLLEDADWAPVVDVLNRELHVVGCGPAGAGQAGRC